MTHSDRFGNLGGITPSGLRYLPPSPHLPHVVSLFALYQSVPLYVKYFYVLYAHDYVSCSPPIGAVSTAFYFSLLCTEHGPRCSKD